MVEAKTSVYSKELSLFRPVSLDEMDDLKLMNRLDNKYVFSVDRLPDVLSEASKHYHVLEINGQRDFFYLTKYLDTPDFHFYTMHHNGRGNRYKVRMRTYEVNNQSYLEIKHKTNKGNTKKSRIKIPNTDELSIEGKDFINSKTDVNANDLQIVSVNGFNRITLASFETHERITIDYNLSFTQHGETLNLSKLCIAEVKRERSSARTPIIDIMKIVHGCNTGMSKYCVGTAMLNKQLKQNTFKERELLISKIERNEYFNY